MQIIGFNFSKISVERKKPSFENLKISSDIKIKDIAEESIPLIKDQKVIRFDFAFAIEYTEDIASLNFEGSILAILEQDKFQETLKKWKDKVIPDDISYVLFNLILKRCTLRALSLEEEFNLPPHIPLPSLSPQTKEPKSTKESKK